ncbi:MAG: DHA2 family efflux MFS transporter permease subunit [Desulfovibrionales bacterium]|nr:DHA2 family efflux MFS transporter permease subunit [Desulfovibrionales bacterium]
MLPQRPVNKWIITITVMLPTLIEIIDISITNVALHTIQGSVSADRAQVTWIVTSYLVANAIVIPMSSWLSQVFGRKRYLMLSIALFTVASLLCGTATDLTELLTFRVLQGAGGGGLQPLSQAILLESFPQEERSKALAVFGLGAVSGPIFGPFIGGWITDNYSWRWIFFINFPFGLVALAMVMAFITDPPHQKRLSRGDAIDWQGIIFLTLGIGCLQILLDKGQQYDWFGSNIIITLAIVSTLCLLALIIWELHHKQPIINLKLMAVRNYAAGCFYIFIGFFSYFGGIVILPLLLQDALGYSPTQAGEVVGLGGLTVFVMLLLVNKLSAWLGGRTVIVMGVLFCAVAFYKLSLQTLNSAYWDFFSCRAILSIGLPLYYVPISVLTYVYIKDSQLTEATPMFNLLRNLGSSFGVAFASTIVARRSQYHQSVLVNFLTDGNPNYDQWITHTMQVLSRTMGYVPELRTLAKALAYREMQLQSSYLAFMDAFVLMAVIFVAMTLLVFFLHDPKHNPNSRR